MNTVPMGRVVKLSACIVGSIALSSLLVAVPADKVVFLDVGQGDSILIQNKTAQVIIDGGPGMEVLERLGEEMPWFDRTIEVVIATHPDQDHLEGLLYVMERYKVKLVLLPQMPHSTQLQEEWLKKLQLAAENKETEYRFAWRGQQLRLADATISILGPFREEGKIVARGNKTNNAAILSRVDFGEMSFLLTSDAEAAVEKMLVAQTDQAVLDADVLKAGHHGSKTSTTPEFLKAVSPSAVVISVGADNSYGHPHPDVVARLSGLPVWRTDKLGSIKFLYRSNGWFMSCGAADLPWRRNYCMKNIH